MNRLNKIKFNFKHKMNFKKDFLFPVFGYYCLSVFVIWCLYALSQRNEYSLLKDDIWFFLLMIILLLVVIPIQQYQLAIFKWNIKKEEKMIFDFINKNKGKIIEVNTSEIEKILTRNGEYEFWKHLFYIDFYNKNKKYLK